MDDPSRRDQVLVAFHLACAHPTAEDVAAWIQRHPRHAADLRRHAEAAIAAPDHRGSPPAPSPDLLERTRRTTLAVLARVRDAAGSPSPTAGDDGDRASKTRARRLRRGL